MRSPCGTYSICKLASKLVVYIYTSLVGPIIKANTFVAPQHGR